MESSFYDVSLLIAPGRVMTPRPATERLVEAAAARIGDQPARVADVGTGSGAIAVTLALLAPRAEIWATDVSEAAVELTRRNAARYGLAERIHMVRGDLLDPVPDPLDLVVANLPYLPDYLRSARPEYRFEPPEAIYAGGDGLGPYRRLLDAAEEKLAPQGAVLIQLNREVLAAERDELGELRLRLDRTSLAAA